MTKRVTDSMKEKMEYRRGCFFTKSQAKKIDYMKEALGVDIIYIDYFDRIGGDLIIGTEEKEYFMSTRGKVDYYDENDNHVYL